MIKILLTILIMIILPIMSEAALSTSDTLSAVENNLFGYDYKNDTDTSRLDRIEMQLYGNKKTGNIQTRIEDIKNDTGITVSEKKKAVADTNATSQPEIAGNTQEKQQNNRYPTLKEDASVEYPMVDKLEQTIFNTTYKKDNIYARLDRLEDKVFAKRSNADLNTRVNNLTAAIHPKMKRSSKEQTYTAKELDSYYSQSGLDPINSQSLPFQLAALEQDILKSDYTNENNSKRLSRLEEKLFNRTFINDNDTTRLQRIMVAYDAKKQSYLYDNNRKMQNMAAMTQLGGFLLMILAILL